MPSAKEKVNCQQSMYAFASLHIVEMDFAATVSVNLFFELQNINNLLYRQ